MGIIVGAAGGPGGVRTCVGTSRAGRAGVAPGLSEGEAEVFALERVKLLERVDLLEPLADCLEPPTTSLLATFWATASCKGV